MRRRLPSLNALRAFDAAARHLSFTRAADELCVTHGAVSRQIRHLEDELGVALFRRLTRRVVLTPEGEALRASVAAAFEVLEAGVARVGRPRAPAPLVVSCVTTFAMRWLIPRLFAFQARHPEIEIRLSSAPNPLAQDTPDDTDLAIRSAAPTWREDVEARPFLMERIGPVLSPARAAALPIGVPADLAGHVLLHTGTRPDAWTEWARAAGASLAWGGERSFETFYFLLQAAAAGFGVAPGPEPLVADDVAAGRLVAPLGFVPSGRNYYAICRRDMLDDPRVRAFCDWLTEEGKAFNDARAASAGPAAQMCSGLS